MRRSFWCWLGFHHWVDADDGYDRGSSGPHPRYAAACIRDGCWKTYRPQDKIDTVRRKLAIVSGSVQAEKATLSLVVNGVAEQSSQSEEP